MDCGNLSLSKRQYVYNSPKTAGLAGAALKIKFFNENRKLRLLLRCGKISPAQVAACAAFRRTGNGFRGAGDDDPAAFAPAARPTIVVCAMLDNGIGGGRDAGPVVQKVLAAHLRAKPLDVHPDAEALQD